MNFLSCCTRNADVCVVVFGEPCTIFFDVGLESVSDLWRCESAWRWCDEFVLRLCCDCGCVMVSFFALTPRIGTEVLPNGNVVRVLWYVMQQRKCTQKKRSFDKLSTLLTECVGWAIYNLLYLLMKVRTVWLALAEEWYELKIVIRCRSKTVHWWSLVMAVWRNITKRRPQYSYTFLKTGNGLLRRTKLFSS